MSDNLRCFFESKPVDVKTKRRHTDWLDDYINSYLVSKGLSESKRKVSTAAIQQFYTKNDSKLFGDFEVSKQQPRVPPKPLAGPDIRQVLKALPLNIQLPLLFVWQSGCEINRVLGRLWGDVDLSKYPMPLSFYGRKKHRRPYGTYLGRECVERLKVWRQKWAEMRGRQPREKDLIFLGKGGAPMNYGWIDEKLRDTAARLFKEALVKNGNPESWHTHALRHSFETEAAHAGVKSEIRDYFLGHVGGIQWIYNHRDEIHPEDLEKEYLKIEPYVSLEPGEITIREEYEQKEKRLYDRVIRLEEQLAALLAQRESSSAPGPLRASGRGQTSEP